MVQTKDYEYQVLEQIIPEEEKYRVVSIKNSIPELITFLKEKYDINSSYQFLYYNLFENLNAHPEQGQVQYLFNEKKYLHLIIKAVEKKEKYKIINLEDLSEIYNFVFNFLSDRYGITTDINIWFRQKELILEFPYLSSSQKEKIDIDIIYDKIEKDFHFTEEFFEKAL